MTIITDIQFEPELSPRLITLNKTSTDLIMQDLHDTVTDWEDELQLGMSHDRLISSAGKEDLGGGVLVGITSTLQNAQLEFEPRTTPLSSGTATSAGTTILIDSFGTFEADNISRGDIIINFTDFSMGTVLSVESEIQLTHKILTGGTNNDWTDSDVYRIYDVVQVEIAGGNLVAIDEVSDPLPAILPSFGTQIVRTSSSSSTISEIEANTYFSADGIHVDMNSNFSGTSFPIGTPSRKVNNLADAFIIANKHGITRFHIYSNITIPSACPDWTFIGNINEPVVNFNGQNVNGSLFKGVNLQGTMIGIITANNCVLEGVNGLDGFFRNCSFGVQINSVASGSAMVMEQCFSRVPGLSTPIIDMGSTFVTSANIRHYAGGLEIRNLDHGDDNITIDLLSGHIILASNCIAGNIVIRGTGKLTDNSTGSIVNTDGFINKNDLTKVIYDRPLTGATHNIPTSAGKRIREIAEIALFDGSVHIDSVNGQPGTTEPIGTARFPSNNITDARTIADTNGLTAYTVKTDLTLNADHIGWRFTNTDGIITLNFAGFNINNSFCDRFILSGIQNGIISTKDCTLLNLLNMDGNYIDALFRGTNTIITGGAPVFFQGFSGVPGTGTPVIDFQVASASDANIRAYSGGIAIRNFDTANNLTIELVAGQVILESTCTAGTIVIRGIGKLTDNSTGTTVDTSGFVSGEVIDAIDKNTKLIPALV